MRNSIIRPMNFLMHLLFISLTLNIQAQTTKNLFIGGTWLGYISIDGKPTYKLQVLTQENDDKTFKAGIYYYPFTNNADPFRYDTVKLYINEKDTSAAFDIAVPKTGGGDYCKGRITITRPDLTTMQISAKYRSYNGCNEVKVFLNEPQTIFADTVYNSSPEPQSKPASSNSINNQAQQNTITEDNAADGAALLFKNIKDKISDEEKLVIFKSLKLSLSKDKKQFIQTGNSTNIFNAEAETADLNGDNTKEIIVNWGNYITSGQYGQELVIFSKQSDGTYKKIMETSGTIGDVIPEMHYGYPDLSIAGPGMQTPLWRFDGNKYQFYRGVSDAEYKKLHPVHLSDFEKDRAVYTKGKDNNNAPTFSSLKMVAPSAATKHYIYQRWKTSDVIGRNRESFLRMKDRNESTEIEFSKNGQCYFYKNGVLDRVLSFIVAPDGKSILLTKKGQSDSAPLQILSLKAKEMIIKYPGSENDISVLKTN